MRTDLAVLLGLLALAFASMPIYASRAAGRRDPLDVDQRGSFVLGNFVRSWFYWFIRPVERLSLAVGASPTAFNLLGVAFGVAAGVAFAQIAECIWNLVERITPVDDGFHLAGLQQLFEKDQVLLVGPRHPRDHLPSSCEPDPQEAKRAARSSDIDPL